MSTDTLAPFSELRPSAYYFRQDLDAADNIEMAKQIGFAVIHEHERLRAWCRDQGLTPPKWMVSENEAIEKGWKMKR